jgi:hypothetical protein
VFFANYKVPLLICAAGAFHASLSTGQTRFHHYELTPHAQLPSGLPVIESVAITGNEVRNSVLPAPIPKERPAQTHNLANRLDPIIGEASRRFVVPEEWIRSVIQIESGGRTMVAGKPLTSTAGAIGVMQLMNETYNDMRRRHGLGSDPSDVRDNILAGTAYLRELYERYGYPSLFAAYNAGPTRMEHHLTNGVPLPLETIEYMQLVTHDRRGIRNPD